LRALSEIIQVYIDRKDYEFAEALIDDLLYDYPRSKLIWEVAVEYYELIGDEIRCAQGRANLAEADLKI
jgi:hypothetical protein